MRVVALRLSAPVRKEIVGVERRPAEKVPAASVKLIGSRFRDDAYDGATVIAILRGKAVVLEIKFLDALDRRLILHI